MTRVFVRFDQISTLYFNAQGFKPDAINFDGPTFMNGLLLGLDNVREAVGAYGTFKAPEGDGEAWTMEVVGLTYQAPPPYTEADEEFWIIP